MSVTEGDVSSKGLVKALESAHDAPPPRRRWFVG